MAMVNLSEVHVFYTLLRDVVEAIINASLTFTVTYESQLMSKSVLYPLRGRDKIRIK